MLKDIKSKLKGLKKNKKNSVDKAKRKAERQSRRNARRGRKNGIDLKKITAVLVIFLMATIDYFTMTDLFVEIGLSDDSLIPGLEFGLFSTTAIFSFVFALLFEGNPTFMGWAMAEKFDVTVYEANRKTVATYAFYMSLAGFILTVVIVGVLRVLLIIDRGGIEAFKNGIYALDSTEYQKIIAEGLAEYKKLNPEPAAAFNATEYFKSRVAAKDIFWSKNGEFSKDVIFTLLPVATSILAFVASYYALGKSSIEALKDKVTKLNKKYIYAEAEFRDLKYKTDDARKTLWTSLTVTEPMPKTLSVYRECCYEKIKDKMIYNSVEQLEACVKLYNESMASVLGEFISEMSRHTTTIPRDIVDLNINDILKEHDKKVKEAIEAGDCHFRPSDGWGFDLCGEEMKEELKKILDNAVVSGQFKTVVKPYNKERNI